MAPQDTLQPLIAEGTVEQTLERGSGAKDAIRALQTLLHELGFDEQMQWQRFGADGDYGDATAAAVKAFAQCNGLSGDGAAVTRPMAAKMIDRYGSLDELQQLYHDLQEKRIEQTYYRDSPDTIPIAALQTLLHALGFDKELSWDRYGADGQYGGSTTDAVKAFAAQEGIASDGTRLSPKLAQRIIDKLAPYYGSGWATAESTAAVQAGTLTIRTVSHKGKKRIHVSNGTTENVFGKFKRGVFTNGKQKPLDFVREYQEALRSLGLTNSAINVMVAVAENEGNLDAINTWDNAFLSFGMFQWTAGVGNEKGELPALMQRIKAYDQAIFEQYYGQYGLDVVDTNMTYGYFSLNGKRLNTTTEKEQLRAPAWAFYFWLSGQSSEVQTIEIQHALSRLETFYTTDRYKVDEYYVSDLVTSEYGVGLILDNHVNRPAYVKGCLKEALDQTGLPDPGRWGTAEERRLIAAYLKIRETYGRLPMTDAAKRAAVTKKYLNNGTISDERGSFEDPFV